MDNLDLSFTFKDGMRWAEGRFEIDDLMITDTGDNYEVSYDGITLYVDGKPYNGTAESWSGHKFAAEEIFDQVLSDYLTNNQGVYTSFGDGWSAFLELNSLKEYEGDLLIKLPRFEYGEICIYDLDLATPKFKYYTYDDECLMLDNDNALVTDMENFYTEAITEDITDILQGNLECLYMGYNVKEMIKEMGGEEAWLEEFGNS